MKWLRKLCPVPPNKCRCDIRLPSGVDMFRSASVLTAMAAVLVAVGPLRAQQAPAGQDTVASPADTLPAAGVQGSPTLV